MAKISYLAFNYVFMGNLCGRNPFPHLLIGYKMLFKMLLQWLINKRCIKHCYITSVIFSLFFQLPAEVFSLSVIFIFYLKILIGERNLQKHLLLRFIYGSHTFSYHCFSSQALTEPSLGTCYDKQSTSQEIIFKAKKNMIFKKWWQPYQKASNREGF